MKVGYQLRSERLLLVVTIIVCATVITWTRKSGLIPGDQRQFNLTPDSVPSEDGVVVGASKEITNEKTIDGDTTRIEERKSNVETDSQGIRQEEMTEEDDIEGKGSEETQRNGSENEEAKTAPMGPTERYSNRSEVKACNYAEGKWIVDPNQTLYSGFRCKQWLRSSWSCQLSRRPDFAYENLRWQPKDCPLERFEGSKFLKRLENKTLAFVGDSICKQQFLSLICMITGGNQRYDIINVAKEYKGSQALRFTITNTTILHYWSTTLCDVKPMNATNPNSDNALHLDRPPPFLTKNIHRFNILVLNTMHHWNPYKFKENRWVVHVGGVPNKNLQEIWKARNFTVHSVINWANTQMAKYPNLTVFYRTMSPRHFVGGDWNTGGTCDNTTPLFVGQEIAQDRLSDSVAVTAVKGTRVRLLDITGLSEVRSEAHISRYHGSHISNSSDCSHWCLPGLPDTWNEIFSAKL